ncbi:MAG: DUF2188 domain-containing protein [Phototrophicaceae bacterium]
MANKHNQHVVPTDTGWAVKGEGNSKYTAHFDTQAEAIERAMEIAKNYKSELLIHGENGEIRERNTYGDDPNPPKG